MSDSKEIKSASRNVKLFNKTLDQITEIDPRDDLNTQYLTNRYIDNFKRKDIQDHLICSRNGSSEIMGVPSMQELFSPKHVIKVKL